MRFRPCIDLHNGKVKQIVGGTLSDNGAVENFVSDKDAAYYARLYKRDNLYGGHVIMLGPGNEEEALKALGEFPGGLQIGGGINPENAAKYLEAGASHVIVTSFVFYNGSINMDNLLMMERAVGKEKLVLDLSCRKKNGTYYVVTDRWQKFTDFALTRENILELESHCSELLVHAAEVEGLKQGIDCSLVELLGDFCTLPVTYAGGVRDLDDIRKVYSLGKGRVDLTIGSSLDIFGGSLKYQDVISLDLFKHF
ncbi:MAG TPA: phosphoribosylformimino-5-aminoimidazole carboxamide ribotide isomerase [Spirochaetota bacterium]|jgi:phosphoribosylformimino-5-aminoimidazole carboxamide ribotide isomerase|nr:phosphoribosylformimino-5-aminoimidazole carboxamide ribotide isomerase [Spirochaetota bacterium]HOK93475.1 phosphoribosylformimino-5-aminoimidazole carboxamide ribotide isomerase [Spirochaetota bacterium]HON16495.1 phosphoribosylformimino-5-aminoimidazole carboxamide ribotide isomerase [Spirochaetota bacterium]HPD78770.1 phosphoribosylformimino-5-aminoimidazole carboxamide ribotide isomerase [Spirochaetota bacterium]HPP96169.1 phosphoribosylformimino-5-aminoimidazole carboxamide ribotide is